MKIIEGNTIKKKGIHIICMMTLAFQFIYGQEPPVEFEFNQSTLQAFYFFTDVTLNGASIESDDWVAAFRGDVCVGARQWDTSNCGGGMCDAPAMGDNGGEYTAGYMQIGDIPTFKIYDASSGNIFDASPSEEVDSWSINGFSLNDLLIGGWLINPADFQYNGSITLEVHLNGVAIGTENDMLAAFVDGAIRGVANGMQSPFGNIVFPIMIYSNDTSGETLEFVYYDSSSNLYVQLNETLEFIIDMTVGTADNPFILTGDTDDIWGCTDLSACNYNVEALLDDGSCEYPSGCDNTCGSTLEFDECGVCGGGGVADLGCGCFEAGPSGCDNECDSTATEDCAGVCGGDAAFDNCGDCNGGNAADLGCGCDQSGPSGCDNTCGSDAVDDCAGECGGVAVDDECGVCDGDGSTCTDEIVGCMDDTACNFNSDATFDNESCWWAIEGCDCSYGEGAVVDDCGVCEGANADDLGCGCFEPGPSGCDNTCGSTLVNDECGECGGNISDASNCLSIDTYYVNNFSINSIYPNPFNPVVNIDLSIDIVGHLQLSVFTIEGIQIKTIYNGPSSIGESTFTWRPENRASGFYFVSAVIDNQVKTKKVLFLK